MFQTNPSRTKKKQPLERHHKTSRGEIQLSARISSSNVLCWHYKGTTVYIGKVQCLLCQEGLHDPWCGAKTRHRLFLVFFFFSFGTSKKPRHRYKEYLDLQKGVHFFIFYQACFHTTWRKVMFSLAQRCDDYHLSHKSLSLPIF